MSWRARLSKSLNELRIIYCPSTSTSAGTRDFVKNHYKDLKALNPGLPIYVRPADGVEPHIAARYERGVYEVRHTAGMSDAQVLSVVRDLEGAASEVNVNVGGGIGGNAFKIADIV